MTLPRFWWQQDLFFVLVGLILVIFDFPLWLSFVGSFFIGLGFALFWLHFNQWWVSYR